MEDGKERLYVNGKPHQEYQYLDLLRDILQNGNTKGDFATGEGLKSVFGRQLRYDLSDGTLPVLTTKQVPWKWAIKEMLWFLKGDCDNVKGLTDQGISIWDEWAFKGYESKRKLEDIERGQQVLGFMPDLLPKLSQEELIQKIKENPKESPIVKGWGNLGPIYGSQWRHWKREDGKEIDQIAWAEWKTRKYPERKHVLVSAWNPAHTYEMSIPGEELSLPPCHTMFQIYVAEGKLSLQLYQRSADTFLGVPFNMTQYAWLTHALAHTTGFKPGEFVHTFGDVHIYSKHLDAVNEQLKREPAPFPKLEIKNKRASIDDFVFEDFDLKGYKPQDRISAQVTSVGGYRKEDRDEFLKK